MCGSKGEPAGENETILPTKKFQYLFDLPRALSLPPTYIHLTPFFFFFITLFGLFHAKSCRYKTNNAQYYPKDLTSDKKGGGGGEGYPKKPHSIALHIIRNRKNPTQYKVPRCTQRVWCMLWYGMVWYGKVRRTKGGGYHV